MSDHKRIWSLAWPAILANSSAPLVGLVDTWAIGHLPDAVHLAAVGLGTVIFNYIFWSFGFLRMGTTGLVAQAYGREDLNGVRENVVRGMFLGGGIGLGLIFFQVPLLQFAVYSLTPPDNVEWVTEDYFYTRIWAAPASLMVYVISGILIGMAEVKAMLVLQLLLNILNGVLNVIFVVGMDMGVVGVALGTVIAQWVTVVAGVVLLGHYLGVGALLHSLAAGATYHWVSFRKLLVLNGYIFVRTILLMTAIALIMKVAGTLGDAEMAASHVVTQYILLMALGLDGFAHAAEALTGAAWGRRNREEFKKWVYLTNLWALGASVIYLIIFYIFGNSITAILTDLDAIRSLVADLMPIIILTPLIAVWSYQYDGIFIGATAAPAMLWTMAISFVAYIAALSTYVPAFGIAGLWYAYAIFLGVRGLTQYLYMRRLYQQFD